MKLAFEFASLASMRMVLINSELPDDVPPEDHFVYPSTMIARDELDLYVYPSFPANEKVRRGVVLTH